MAFCTLDADYVREGYTQVDNVFLSKYMPDADATDVKVYLYGLMLALGGRGADNTKDAISLALRLTAERVDSAFAYWADSGLISYTSDGKGIMYNSVKAPTTKAVYYNAREYSEFVDELRRVFPEKIIPEQDIVRYVETLRLYKIEQNAMLLIARYCRDAKGTTNTASVVGLASAWAKQGLTTERAVNARLDELERNSEEMKNVYTALGLRSEPSVEDAGLYVSWTAKGFKPDTIMVACRACKRRGGMQRLVRLMDELYSAKALTAVEADEYLRKKDEIKAFAEQIIRTLGSFYATLDMPIETYINPWLSLGFEKNALSAIAKFCFMRNIRTLDGMQVYVDKFYKLGVVTEQGIDAYVQRQNAVDNAIREVLSVCGAEPFISARDRDFYRTFAEDWGFEQDVILTVASYARNKPFPMSYINKILLTLKENGIRTVEGAKKLLEGGLDKKKDTTKDNIIKQDYTAAEVASAFMGLDDINPDDVDI